MKNARTHARTHALRIRIAPTAPQLLTPNTTAAHKTHPTHTQNSTAFSTALKHPTARLIARSLSAVAQKLSNVFNVARKSLAKTHHQNSTAFSTALKHPVARLTAHNLSATACRHTQFHILTVHPTEARQHPARAPRPVPPLRASRRAVCFFYSHHRLNDLDGIHKAN